MKLETVEDNMEDSTYSSIIYNFFKRIFDIAGSLIGIMIAVPIIAVFAVLIRIETPGNVLYRQSRLGKNGKEFTLYKLRSMVNDAEAGGAQWADKDDMRVTRTGKLIRLTRIDELPQLFNVLAGDMSIVGPRPERPMFVKQFIETTPGFEKRMLVKPGLTGWAQVNGGYDLTPEKKLDYDLYYIKHQGLLLDLQILFKTVKVILTGEGAR